jgi:hypothetical protein
VRDQHCVVWYAVAFAATTIAPAAAEERRACAPPKQKRVLLQDTTIEAVQEVIKDSPNGLLYYQDELSGWFGAMDKYSRGANPSNSPSMKLSTKIPLD